MEKKTEEIWRGMSVSVLKNGPLAHTKGHLQMALNAIILNERKAAECRKDMQLILSIIKEKENK